LTADLSFSTGLGIFYTIFFSLIPEVVITKFRSCSAGIPLLFLKYTLQETFYKEKNFIPKAQRFERNGLGKLRTAIDKNVCLKYKETESIIVENMKNYPRMFPTRMFSIKIIKKI
jgi:hypothetical protein